ncbi:phosphatase PAP2 family protein [Clostridium sp. Mt-5]|uniref:Phosphatase PAP2 family protein n=1 Tax=Clostridium moutaii TaxID=3240932 RepID=A0ABV4BL35_9CLOT
MKNIKANFLPLSLMFIIPVINIMYGKLNNSINGCYNLVTDFDRSIPFIKEFIIPYWMWYPFIILTIVYICFNCRNAYYKTMITIVFGMLSCYIIYFFFQTTVPRPAIQGNDIFSHIIRLTYKWDKPFNCFPSIHVLTCYAVVRGARETKKIYNKFIINFMAIIIMVSTQLVKQHVILDLIFAILLAEVIYRFFAVFILERSTIWGKKLYWWWTMKKKLEI